MTRPFFGEFLLEQGVIRADELSRAVELQKQSNRLLGQLGVKAGYLTRQQVFDILYQQKKTSRRFGQIAVELGHLSPEQLQSLLLEQAENHMFLGEVIVRLNLVDGAQMNDLVNRFGRLTRRVDAQVETVLDSADGPSRMRHVLDVVRDGLFQLGFTTKITEIAKGAELARAQVKNLFLAKHVANESSYAFGITGSNQILDMLARVSLEKFEQDQTYRLYVVMTRFVDQLNKELCRRLKAEGRKARPGMVKNALVPHTRAWTARLRTMPECFELVYLEHATD